ncbi:MAG TPA: carboxypeptidase-like regulatory domain-containing protein [Candidatus Sulfotelmatobacter sp.]|nr:carboxypeptidase-like regulatory domain-containing protein [Candidatus Sulfotelmatobacter sp.]
MRTLIVMHASSSVHRLVVLFAFSVAASLPVEIAFAQSVSGTVSGTVVDQQQRSVPGATVRMIDQLHTTGLTTETNGDGYFVFTQLAPGTYRLSVAKEGFEKVEINNIVVLTADRLSMGNVTLKIGSSTVVVTVTSETPPVATTSSEQSAVVSAQEMAALPVLGNDYVSLTKIIPGSTYLGNGFNTLSVISSQASFMGIASPSAAYFSTNGVFSSLSNYSWDDSPTVVANIQDVKVLVSGYEPERGKAQGAVLDVTTKSGAKDFHGSLWYSFRNEALNANDYFNNLTGQAKSRYRFNTVTGTLGGPLFIPRVYERQRSKLFFFFSYDNEPSTVPQSLNELRMPTALERTGDFSQSFFPGTTQQIPVYDPITHQQYPGNVVNPDQIDQTMQDLLNWFPAPNFTNVDVSQGFYNYVVPAVAHNPVHQASLRVDYAPTDKWRILGRWQRGFFGSTGVNEPGISAGWNGPQSYNNSVQRIELNVAYTVSTHMVNELAGGYTGKYEQTSVPPSTLQGFQMATTGISLPQLYPQTNPLGMLPGFSFRDLSHGPNFSYDPRFPMDNRYYGVSVADNFTYIHKSHQLKVGVYFDDEHQNQPHHLGGGNPGGLFNLDGANPSNPYNVGYSFAEALLGYFDSNVQVTNFVDDSNTAKALQWYAQDNWQVSRRLSLNYGARFSYDIPQAITGGQGAVLHFNLYEPSAAPVLFQPVLVNGVRMMENPLNGETFPAAYLDYYVHGSGTIAPGTVSVGSPDWRGIFHSQHVIAEPRFGFAYDLFGDGKTAIRGGIGRFVAMRTFSGSIFGYIINPPAISYPTSYYGNITDPSAVPGLLGPPSTNYGNPNAKLPYSYSWSLGVQRSVGFNSVLSATYVGLVSRNGPYSFNRNEVPYGAEFLPQNQDPTTGTPLPDDYFRPYPGYSSINDSEWGNNANYNSLQVTFNRRMSRGLSYGIAYTYSKALDDRKSATYLPYSLTYGPSSNDMRNRLTPYWVWELPKASTHWNNGFSRWALDNWEVSGIASFISGQPMNVNLSTTNNENITGGGDGAQVILAGNPVLPKSDRTFNHYFNPNVFALPATGQIGTAWNGAAFYGPGVHNWDIVVAKHFRFGERVDSQLRVEMYNTFNHPQWSGVNNTALFDPSTGDQVNSALGRITADRGPRIMQLALRIGF